MRLRNAILLTLLSFCVAAPVMADSVLIVADEWPQMELLGNYLHDKGGYDIEKVEQDDMPDDLSGYAGVFEFVHGDLKDGPAQALMDYAENGGRLIVVHHGISSAKKKTKGWLPFVGIELDRAKDAEHQYSWVHGVDFTLVNLNPNHYITSHNVEYHKTIEYQSSDQPSRSARLPAIEFRNTEVFLNHQFTDGREKTVLFGFRYQDPKTRKVYMQDRSGWLKRVGRGYAFYFHPGHTVSDFENAQYCQIIMNCLTWKPRGSADKD
jgi:type 1 glutamine amidotransferase